VGGVRSNNSLIEKVGTRFGKGGELRLGGTTSYPARNRKQRRRGKGRQRSLSVTSERVPSVQKKAGGTVGEKIGRKRLERARLVSVSLLSRNPIADYKKRRGYAQGESEKVEKKKVAIGGGYAQS